MARLTKELKSLVERQLVVKIQETVREADRARAAVELEQEVKDAEARNAIREQLSDTFAAVREANKVLQKNGKLFNPNAGSNGYRGYDPQMKFDNFDPNVEKIPTVNNKTYYSVSCTNSVGNISIHNTSVSISGGAKWEDKDVRRVQDAVKKIVDDYDKALVAVALGGDLGEAREILTAYGISL